MISAAVAKPSFPNWGSRCGCRHHGPRATMIHGYDRMVVMKPYARRRRGEEPKEKSAAVGSPDSSRVCADCRTSKTPLWRSGPNGPKSLCNACGIRYRKKRRKTEINGEEGADKQQKTRTATTSTAATTTIKGKNENAMASLEAVGEEELRRRQKEKQEKMLMLLLERQKQRRREASAMAAAGRGAGAGKEEAEAALLLLSLSSSRIFVHS